MFLRKPQSSNQYEHQDIPLEELRKLREKDGNEYIQLLKKKTNLESIFYDKSIDPKTRAEAGLELSTMLDSFHKFEKAYLENLKTLLSREVENLTEEQRNSLSFR